MSLEGLADLPPWLIGGVLLGLAGSLLATVAFLAAERIIPGEPRERSRGGDGTSRRRVEFREYLDAIDEAYAEDHPVEGQTVALYLPERDVAITFDARVYYRIERSDTDAVLAEHEMPGTVLGERLPFETPEVDFEERAADPTRAAFAELGVPVGAPLEDVKRAYRKRIIEVHPDQGGDEDAFKRLREAYTLAKQHAD